MLDHLKDSFENLKRRNLIFKMSSKVIGTGIRTLRSSNFKPTKAPFSLTPLAVKELSRLLELEKNAKGIRIGVRERGCTGMSYQIEYALKQFNDDLHIEQDHINIFIHRRAQLSLFGTEMDFIKTRLTKEFVFNNPNVKTTCGCGESFTI
ncbi:hypothetical protein SNEBB_008836 [Seison nebaliae]|nr:hypothetical protein SNEBB_008836 [Seison nebaliae]